MAYRRKRRRKNNYLTLLISLIVLPVAASFLQDSHWERVCLSALLAAVMVASSFTIAHKKRGRIIAIALAILASSLWGLGNAFHLPAFDWIAFQVASCLASLTFLLVVSMVIITDIFSGKVDFNRLCASICVYLLIGLIFALLSMLISTLHPDAYRMSLLTGIPSKDFSIYTASERFSIFVYYSFATLSTVGYGDVTPVGRVARTFSWLEAIIGQLYLTVMVARLVGLHIATAGKEEEA
ncbi:MAG: hypothetical protein K2W82_19000 [Candidatus Obscuribacterales bacterium]|nr:hypothetical protein [Candidatus Obscuribacterales bacterium]